MAIETVDLGFSYGTQAVLSHVSLSVPRGEFVGLIGPNGGGKTTLLRILLGLEKNYSGTARILGENPASGGHWRARVGFVPQARNLPPRFPVLARDVVEFGTRARGAEPLGHVEREQRILDALSKVGAEALVDRPIWKLSGGQKQRIFLARALASRPELLLLDEPTVGVDAHGEDLLLHWIQEWRRERNMTVVLVSHDVGVIAPLCDKIACLNNQLHFHDRPDQLTGAALEQTYGCPAELIFHSHGLPHRVVDSHS